MFNNFDLQEIIKLASDGIRKEPIFVFAGEPVITHPSKLKHLKYL